VSVRDVAETLQFTLGDQRYGFFILGDKQYEVVGQLERSNRNQPANLKQIYVRSRGGAMITLDNLIRVNESSSPPTLFRFNRLSSATVSANLADGSTIGDGIEAMRRISSEMLDERFTTELAGQSRDFVDSSTSLVFVFIFALVLVYLVLAAQFESFRDPLIILTTVPLSICGALIPMNMGLATVNIYTQVGLVTLIGLISKHGILMVEFANELQEREGLDRRSAIVKSAAIRLRPILMTTAAMVVGMVPLLMASGAGAKSRFDNGLVLAARMTIRTIFTLFVLPVIYTFIARKRTKEDEAPAALPAPPAPQPAE
jgi:multidrug efflux pump